MGRRLRPVEEFQTFYEDAVEELVNEPHLHRALTGPAKGDTSARRRNPNGSYASDEPLNPDKDPVRIIVRRMEPTPAKPKKEPKPKPPKREGFHIGNTTEETNGFLDELGGPTFWRPKRKS